MIHSADPSNTVCVAMPKSMNVALEEIARKKLKSKSDIIRDAIVEYFANDPVAREIYNAQINGVVSETV